MVGDLFHWGHVELLRQARALGDYLIVGVHADDDVESYKRRPVMTLDERVRIVEACRYVDEVIPGSPLVLTDEYLDEHAIDLVVHGDDFNRQTIMKFYAAAVRRGIFQTVPYTPGISTTDLLARPAARQMLRDARVTEVRQKGQGAKRALKRLSKRVPAIRQLEQRIQRAIFTRDLRRLHDVLAKTQMAHRYFVFGGLLIGWAREGDVLRHDAHDADFAYRIEDADAFEKASEALTAAGFRRTATFHDRNGELALHRFSRHRADFEFFALRNHNGRLRYATSSDDEDLICEFPGTELERFDFIGRSWLKPADHEELLRLTYGDWRTPDPNWDARDDGTIVERWPRRAM
jgi:cytidyltransferase-like protein